MSEYLYSMSPSDEGGPPERPDYKVYRSRRGPRLSKPDFSSLRDRARRGRRDRREDEPRLDVPGPERRRGAWWWLRRIGLVALGWLLLSALAFGISAQIQKGKLADTGNALGGNPLLAAFPQNILILGTDVRSSEFASSEAQDDRCVDAAASGEVAPDGCEPARADTIMILRAGGGAFERLSIPRDTWAEIPGHGNAKINAAFANGGAELQVRAVENLLGIEINHVAIVDFGGFQDFIDAIGGVKVKLPQKVCSSISGGTYNVRLTAGEHTLNGEKALALARTRQQNGFVDSDGDGVPDADQPKACQNPPPIDDLDRTRFQQLILQGVKDRLTDPWRVPRNFIFGPWIGWNAPKAFVSDMGAFTMPQLAFAAVIGGGSKTTVLRPSGPGPEGSLFVPQENCARAVRRLTGDAPDEPPACSPAG
jgi:LCP family protein required for cell wall assembly